MIVELIRDILSRGPAAEVLILHLLDPLDGVIGDCVEGTHDAAICECVSLRVPFDIQTVTSVVANSLQVC